MNKYAVIDKDQEFNEPLSIYDRAANWALAGFGDDDHVRLTAKDQRRLLGFVVGKGRVFCDWSAKCAYNVVSACFGTDTTFANCYSLETGKRIY